MRSSPLFRLRILSRVFSLLVSIRDAQMRRRIERSEIKIIASPTAFRRFGCCGNVRSAITSTPAKIEATESTRKFDAVTIHITQYTQMALLSTFLTENHLANQNTFYKPILTDEYFLKYLKASNYNYLNINEDDCI